MYLSQLPFFANCFTRAPCSMPAHRKWICKDPCPEMSLILGISQEKPMLLHIYSVNNGGSTAILHMCNEFG